MKEYRMFLFLALLCTLSIQAATYCQSGTFQEHEECTKFYFCSSGTLVTFNCYNETVWVQVTQRCDIPENADREECKHLNDPTTTPTEIPTSQVTTTESSTTTEVTTKTEATTTTESTTTTEVTTTTESTTTTEVPTTTESTTTTEVPTTTESTTTTEVPTTTESTTTTEATTTTESTTTTEATTTTEPITTTEVTTITEPDPSTPPATTEDVARNETAVDTTTPVLTTSTEGYCEVGTFLPHPECNKYYFCSGDLKFEMTCGEGEVWLQSKEQCGLPSDAERPECHSDDTLTTLGTSNPQNCQIGTFQPHPDCDKYYYCFGEWSDIRTCPEGEVWIQTKLECGSPLNADRLECIQTGSITASIEFTTMKSCVIGTYLPHRECDKYYYCFGEGIEQFSCQTGTVWSQNMNLCVLPEYADRNECKNTYLNNIYQPHALFSSETCEEGTLSPDNDCTKYHYCIDSQDRIINCPDGTVWVQTLLICTTPQYADRDECKNLNTSTTTTSTTTITTQSTTVEPTTINPTPLCEIGTFEPQVECNKYYYCFGGGRVEFYCPPGTVWVQSLLLCTSPLHADRDECKNPNSSITTTPEGSTATSSEQTTNTPMESCEIGEFQPDADCNKYYYCFGEWREEFYCPPGTVWVQASLVCRSPLHADRDECKNPNSSTTPEVTTITTPPVVITTTTAPEVTEVTTITMTSEQTTITPTESCETGNFQPHVDCGKYYYCFGGWREEFDCPNGTVWVQASLVCTSPLHADRDECKDSNNATSIPETTLAYSCQTGTFHPHIECDKYYYCFGEFREEFYCPNGTVWVQTSLTCSTPINADRNECKDPNSSKPPTIVTTSRPRPTPPIGILTTPPTPGVSCIQGTIKPHEDCNKFYFCDNSVELLLTCPEGTIWIQTFKTCGSSQDGDRDDCRTTDGTPNTTITTSSVTTPEAATSSDPTPTSTVTDTTSDVPNSSATTPDTSSSITTISSITDPSPTSSLETTTNATSFDPTPTSTVTDIPTSSATETTSNSSSISTTTTTEPTSSATDSTTVISTTAAPTDSSSPTVTTTTSNIPDTTTTSVTETTPSSAATTVPVPDTTVPACQQGNILPDDDTCDTFYYCDGGRYITGYCPEGSIWVQSTLVCDLPENSDRDNCKI